ncbi:CapA family protein [Noviherbaspirillum sp.]|jgi:poly-gamma-glutamate synthesis protein (capsule biosynthesis protein)|uniref:CapA family protein n=1 Tax=Noviherbaspirillum sp. TaxID=1926288 RepID=UPI0025F5E439|nr:CapA family protein [Noviherbaspirillum sp.]
MMQSNQAQNHIIRVMFGGDVMLGRLVKEAILRYGPDYPLGPIANLMRGADLTVVNLECAITASTEEWQGAPKAFYFGAPPEAVESLARAGVDLVSLANNHVLDFGIEGLRDTLRLLRCRDIRFAGAGEDRREALSPVTLDCGGIRFGMAAFCDHQDDFAARGDRPGMAYLDFDDESAVMAALREALEPLRDASVDWPILSLHWGPNMVFRPSKKFRRIAHAAIEMGWKILFGHSAHVFQGIEIHRGCPIMYAAGDLVDDYYVDPDFRNDHQLLLEMALTRDALCGITLYPVFIEDCQVRRASGAQVDYIVGWMSSLCREMGTPVRREADTLRIEGHAP